MLKLSIQKENKIIKYNNYNDLNTINYQSNEDNLAPLFNEIIF